MVWLQSKGPGISNVALLLYYAFVKCRESGKNPTKMHRKYVIKSSISNLNFIFS